MADDREINLSEEELDRRDKEAIAKLEAARLWQQKSALLRRKQGLRPPADLNSAISEVADDLLRAAGKPFRMPGDGGGDN